MLHVNNLIGFGAGGGVNEFSLVDEDADGAVNGSVWTLTSVVFGDEAPDRYLILVVTGHDEGTETSYTPSATIGGVSATRLTFPQNSDGSDTTFSAVYIANVPTGATGTIVHTLTNYSGTWDGYGYALYRVRGLRSAAGYSVTTGNGDLSPVIPTNGFAVFGQASVSGNVPAWSGTGILTVANRSGKHSSHAYSITAGTNTAVSGAGGDACSGVSFELKGPFV